MSDVFEEVEENLRTERWIALAKRWWPVAAGVAAAALLVVAGFWFFDARKGWTGAEASQAYQRGIDALQADNESGAEAAFVEAEEAGNPAYRALALMQRAAIRIENGETQEAVALFDEAADATNEPLIADIAALKAAWTLMDSASLEDLTVRLTPLTEDGRPFRYHAREALALARLQHGQSDQARQTLQALSLELDVPENVRERAQIALGLIESGATEAIPGIVEAAGRAAETDAAQGQRPGAAPQASAPAAPAAPEQ